MSIVGGDGDDVLQGGAAHDEIFGGAGLDEIFGGDGDDLLYGDEDEDTLDGGDGNDYLDGGTEDDELTGGAGSDYLLGGDDEDTLDGGTGIDRFDTDEDDPTAAPTIDAIANLSVRKDQATAFRIMADDTTDEYAALEFSIDVTGPDGTIDADFSVEDGIFSWQPGPNVDIGSYGITIIVTDLNSQPAQTSFTLTVYNFNDAPPTSQPPTPWPDGLSSVSYHLGEQTPVDFGDSAYDTQTAAGNFSFQLIDAPPYASMTSGGVFTWSLPALPGSGTRRPGVVHGLSLRREIDRRRRGQRQPTQQVHAGVRFCKPRR